MSGDYNRDLEKWMPRLVRVWRQARRQPGPDYLSPQEVKDVGAGVKELSLGLTRERQLAGAKYMDDPKLLGAYLLFYWPVSYAQSRQALGELPKPRSTLDLGSGPGPVGLAALDAGASEVICADRSKPAIELARQLALEANEALTVREWSPERPMPDGPFDLITMGHVVNELFGLPTQPGVIQKRADLLEKVMEKLRPNGTLLIIDPALRETSRALLQVRDLLVQRGYPIRAPCFFRGNCPALLKESDWCHAERKWRPPQLVEQLGKVAGIHKDTLKMSYLAVGSKVKAWHFPPEGRVFRIVSERLEGKGRARFMGCGPEGRMGLALQERHENDDNRAFFELDRGDVIRVTETEPRGDGISLTEKSKVEMIARAGLPVIPK